MFDVLSKSTHRATSPFLRSAGFVLILVVFLSLSGRGAQAAREQPHPLLIQLEEGFGIVAAEVVTADRLPDKVNYPAHYRVTFTVKESLADPGSRLGLKAGDALPIELQVGYAAVVEDWDVNGLRKGGEAGAERGPFAAGARFYLKVRKDDAGKFEHATGASAARRVAQFEPAEARLIARMAELAVTPKERRAENVLTALANPAETEGVRLASSAALNYWLWRDRGELASRQKVIAGIEALWNNPKAEMSTDLVMAVDYLLRGNAKDWPKSESRRRVLLERMFAPYPQDPAARQEAVRKREGILSFLTDMLAEHPAEVGSRILNELPNETWPAHFQWRLASSLQYAYQITSAGRREWADALQAYYPNAIDTADPSSLRLIASSIVFGAEGKGTGKFIAGPETRQALLRAKERMQRMVMEQLKDKDPDAAEAISDVESAVRALDKQE